MDKLEILLYSIVVIVAGGFIVWLMWQNSILRDEINQRRENSVDLRGIPSELKPMAKQICNHHIHVYKKEHGNGFTDS